MADNRIDPSDQIPKADHLDHQTPLAPQSLIDTDPVSTIAKAPADADQTDRWEQRAPAHDDDYLHSVGLGWS